MWHSVFLYSGFLSFEPTFHACNISFCNNKHAPVSQLYALIFKALPILFMHYKQPLKCKWGRNPLSPPAGVSVGIFRTELFSHELVFYNQIYVACTDDRLLTWVHWRFKHKWTSLYTEKMVNKCCGNKREWEHNVCVH